MKLLQRFVILYLLKRYSEEIGKELQKLIFLFQMEGKINCFKFVPYYYGPFSFELSELLVDLLRHKLIELRVEDDLYFYKITDKGNEVLKLL